jgi:UDP-arabinose 4-epimerase
MVAQHMISNRNVFVTGGAGYIGSHACKALAQAGFVPVAYDNLSFGHERAVKWGPFEHGDILDRARLDEILTTYSPSIVMHFAAFAYVGESVADPAKYYRNNVIGSLTLLEAIRDHGVGKIVFSSTCATYGIPETVPIRDDHPQHPINPYGASKVMVERMLLDFGSAYGLRSISLRYFNAAGADSDGEIGEDHDPETHLIPLVLDVATGKRPNITIHGTDYDTPDGTCIRDYIHVTDLAEAHVLAIDALQGGCDSASFNLGTGNGFSVRKVIGAATEITERVIPVVEGPRRAGDPAKLLADATLAKKALGWKPRYGELEQIISTAWNWTLEHQKDLNLENAART